MFPAVATSQAEDLTDVNHARAPLSPREVSRHRRARRHPRPNQFDYLHLRYLVRDLASVLRPMRRDLDVLDVYCGSRPYEDLLPAGSRSVGLDVDNRYRSADVVSNDFLPFPDQSFDLVLCTEAFQYVPDPARGIAEIKRVLRPGGRMIITVSLVWQYDRTILEHRYTGPELAALLEDWDDVEIVENGGYAVAWATLTGRMLNMLERATEGSPAHWFLKPWFWTAYALVNGLGMVLDRVERRGFQGPYTLPMNLRATGCRPVEATRSGSSRQYAPSTASAGSEGPTS
jgi:SAM-dependent methyltransferase